MSKDQAIGAAIVAVCIVAILAYVGLLFLYDLTLNLSST